MKNVFLIAALVFTGFCNAQLYFKNQSTKPVYVAYVMQNNDKSDKSWYSHGWYSVEPGDNVAISSAIGWNQNIYFYAKSHDGKTVWDGTNRDGSVSFLVHPNDAFSIKNANLEYVKEENPAYQWLSFRHIYMEGVLRTKYTITIT